MLNYNFNVVGDRLTIDKKTGVTGNIQMYLCNFVFNADWDEIPNRIAVFDEYAVLIEDDKCCIPWEVLQNKGYVDIGVYGTNTDPDNLKRISTNTLYIEIETGAYRTGTVPDPPELDFWEQTVQMLKTRDNDIDKKLTIHSTDTDIHVTTDEKAAWNAKQDKLTFDDTPAAESGNPVKSGGVYAALDTKADKATTLLAYGINDAYTKTETNEVLDTKSDKTYVDTSLAEKADKSTTLAGYGITDAYTKTETDTALEAKADKTTTLIGYGIADAYTKTEADTLLSAKADITALEEYRKTAEAVNGAQEYEVSNTDSCLIIKNSAQSQAVELNITGSESGVGDLGEDEKYHIPIRVSGNLINPENFKTKGDTVYTYIDGNFAVTKTGTATNAQNKFSFEFPVEAGKTYVMYHKSVGASFDFDSGISVTSHNGEAYWSNSSGNVIYISGNSRIVFTASEIKTITGYIGASVNGKKTTYIYGLSIYEKSIADTYSSDIWSPYFEPAEYDISLDAALLNSKSTKKEITIGQGMNVIQVKTVNAPNKLSLKYLKSLKSIIKEIINAVVALGGTL